MKPTSKEVLEKINKHCSNQLTLYKFNTTNLKISKKYREGRLTVLEYLGELSYYYMQEENRSSSISENRDSNRCKPIRVLMKVNTRMGYMKY